MSNLQPFLTIGRNYEIDAAHYIPGHEKCGVIHGHTWTITVKVAGYLNETTNMVLDFHILNHHVRKLLELIDHTNINTVIEFPSAENISIWLADELADVFYDYPNLTDVTVTIQEGNGGFAEYSTSLSDEEGA